MKEGENIGFVTPTYFWGLPSIVIDFLMDLKLRKSENHFVYHVLTYGTSTGQAHRMMGECLKSNELSLDGKFIVKMVDTWTPMFNLSDKEKNQRILDNADKQIDVIIEHISKKKAGDFNKRKIPFADLFYRTYQNGRKTGKFTVDACCVACELCEKQ